MKNWNMQTLFQSFFEYFCQILSKSDLTILSYTVLSWCIFWTHSVYTLTNDVITDEIRPVKNSLHRQHVTISYRFWDICSQSRMHPPVCQCTTPSLQLRVHWLQFKFTVLSACLHGSAPSLYLTSPARWPQESGCIGVRLLGSSPHPLFRLRGFQAFEPPPLFPAAFSQNGE